MGPERPMLVVLAAHSKFAQYVRGKDAMLLLARANNTNVAPAVFDNIDVSRDGVITEFEWYQAENAKILDKDPEVYPHKAT